MYIYIYIYIYVYIYIYIYIGGEKVHLSFFQVYTQIALFSI